MESFNKVARIPIDIQKTVLNFVFLIQKQFILIELLIFDHNFQLLIYT